MERLSQFGHRVQFTICSLTDDWHTTLPQPPDAICSMSAIHHLQTEGKRALYARCFETLRASGWFFNIDEMSTMYEDAYRRTLIYWVDYVDRSKLDIPKELASYARMWCDKFASWKKRNVENVGLPKQTGDDLHECFVAQMEWLRASGFVNVDLFMKFQLWSVIGGQKHPGCQQTF
jgi:hypothetical protein